MQAPSFTFVTPWYGHFAGGAEVAARMFATQLAGRGFDVEVLTTCCRSPYESWWRDTLPAGDERLDGVLVRRFPVNPSGENKYHEINARMGEPSGFVEEDQQAFIRSTINSDALVEYVRHNTTGRNVLALPYTQGLVHAVIEAMPGRVTLAPCLHDEPQAHWQATAAMVGRCRGLLFLTEEEKTLAIRLFGRALGRMIVESPVVGVGVELSSAVGPHLTDQTAADDARKRYGLPRVYYVYVGRKDAGKNVPRLVHWFDDYRSAGGTGELVFVGGGDRSLVPDGEGFRDLGYVPERDKYHVLSQSAGLINLSENESFSLVVAEAWLCGVPVVVSANSAVTVGHCLSSRGGVAVGDSEEFCEALAALANRPTRERLGSAGAAYVRRHYSWDTVLDRMLVEAA